jgi:hypothetical protein
MIDLRLALTRFQCFIFCLYKDFRLALINMFFSFSEMTMCFFLIKPPPKQPTKTKCAPLPKNQIPYHKPCIHVPLLILSSFLMYHFNFEPKPKRTFEKRVPPTKSNTVSQTLHACSFPCLLVYFILTLNPNGSVPSPNISLQVKKQKKYAAPLRDRGERDCWSRMRNESTSATRP